jgi:arginyl-tRNA synthetase
VIELWKRMNSWVYAGFDATYARIGSDFDKIYYESNTYILGKKLVETGLKKGVFFQQEDGSVWIDLCADGLDQKIVQRRDGTAVYITQDIGLAVERYDEYRADRSVYVVGDEQNYHFKVLKLICQKLGLPSADGIYHLSYGMGLGGLKFFLLRVDPKKKMLFNPEESIDLHGYTATFIQYAYARIRSIFRKEGETDLEGLAGAALLPLEKALAVVLEKYPVIVAQAGEEMNPSLLAAYAFQVAQTFNSFYNVHSVANAETAEKKVLRLRLARLTEGVLRSAMGLMGIRMPERM